MESLRALVSGCGDIGSAVAHRLHGLGSYVVLCDLPAPAHARRGMAYTDALFDGVCQLDGVSARHVADCDAVGASWERGGEIPLVCLSEDELVRTFAFDLAIDATMRRDARRPDIRHRAPLSFGVGPGFTPGLNCHLAIETQWGEALGEIVRDRPTRPLAGGPRRLEGVGRERFVPACATGLWKTEARLGQSIAADQVVGYLAGRPVHAPLSGYLRGLTRNGVNVRSGQRIVEIDPRDVPQIFGLGERPKAVAEGIVRAVCESPGTAASAAR